MTQSGLCVALAIQSLTVTITTPTLAKGVRMSKQFRVTYETKGVKVVNVWLPEGAELPNNWGSMTLTQQDEWLYENQSEAHLNWTDETEGEVVNILPVANLKAV
jgi:hypothetical protein